MTSSSSRPVSTTTIRMHVFFIFLSPYDIHTTLLLHELLCRVATPVPNSLFPLVLRRHGDIAISPSACVAVLRHTPSSTSSSVFTSFSSFIIL